MSKTNPNRLLETRAEAAREAVLTVVAIFTRTDNFIRRKFVASGTGFVVRSNNAGSIVLTANHVLQGLRTTDELYVRTMTPDGVRQVRATVVHRHGLSDVAVLRVPRLRNAPRLVFESNVQNGDGVIGVGYANPDGLFPGGSTFKRIPDLTPGNVIEIGGVIGSYHGVNISHLEMEMVSMKGMSGAPILKATGVVSMLILGDGPSTTGVSYRTLLQVLKRYYRATLSKATPDITAVEMDALVDPMTMAQVINALP